MLGVYYTPYKHTTLYAVHYIYIIHRTDALHCTLFTTYTYTHGGPEEENRRRMERQRSVSAMEPCFAERQTCDNTPRPEEQSNTGEGHGPFGQEGEGALVGYEGPATAPRGRRPRRRHRMEALYSSTPFTVTVSFHMYTTQSHQFCTFTTPVCLALLCFTVPAIPISTSKQRTYLPSFFRESARACSRFSEHGGTGLWA